MTSRTYRIRHETVYEYRRTVTLSQQLLHMTPRGFAQQHVLSHALVIDPAPQDWINRTDYFGNTTRAFTLSAPHRRLRVEADSVVALIARPELDQLGNTPTWEAQASQLRQAAGADLLAPLAVLFPSPHVTCSQALAAYAQPSFAPGRALLDACRDLTQRIHQDFKFDSEATTISTPLLEVLRGRRGVCQDFAHLMIGCLRTLGLACRYVSGYILTTPAPGQPRMVGADASHAWVSVYCSGVGWVDFDPTNRCLVRDEHITLGWGRDFSDVTPMRGLVLGGGGQTLQVAVAVEAVPL